jgi:aminotransferase
MTEKREFIPVFSNSLGQEELDAVGSVLKSRWLGNGPECRAFEAEMAEALGVDDFLLTNSGTASIFLAVKAIGIKPGDEVIIASVNFVSCASAVIEAGAKPVFADVDPHTLNILPSEITRLKTDRTRAVIVLHYGGHPCDMDGVKTAAGDGIAIIEDAAVAFPATYKGQACGTVGDAGIYSFNAVKALAMGDGGGLTFRDPAVTERAKSHRYLGLADSTRSGLDALTETNPQRWWEFQVQDIAGRHISNDILAAIGRVQLRKVPGFIARRREIWDQYQKLFADIPGVITPPEPLEGCESSYFMYWLQVPGRRDALAAWLTENGVYCTFRYFPLHRISHFGPQTSLPGADTANETTLNIPLHQNLTSADIERIVDLVRRFQAGE